MAKDTVDYILERRSVRNLSGEPVKEEDIQKILSVACSAPTGRNLQKLRYYYTSNPSIIKECGLDIFKAISPMMPHLEKRREALGITEPIFYDGSFVIVIASLPAEEEGFEKIDTGIAAGMIMTAAQSLGYRTVPLGIICYADEKIHEHFKIPADMKIQLGVTIGTGAMEDPAKPTSLPMDELCTLVE
ncbi:hypothetical protein ADUPG1_011915 [Aduncisulcus paluster]|uniref:Nitroreductase domain-containing protein n=1 Tax=Aduncisulcus paluster TaxID=2918883 RepID=A0ABQ5JYE6_9EUKA|nr:hypothetical protein ADUPG1_011915 [Aduncisulcus paluster]